jgi:hypothetical protein
LLWCGCCGCWWWWWWWWWAAVASSATKLAIKQNLQRLI